MTLIEKYNTFLNNILFISHVIFLCLYNHFLGVLRKWDLEPVCLSSTSCISGMLSRECRFTVDERLFVNHQIASFWNHSLISNPFLLKKIMPIFFRHALLRVKFNYIQLVTYIKRTLRTFLNQSLTKIYSLLSTKID